MEIRRNETLVCRGEADFTGAKSLSVADEAFSRDVLSEEQLVRFGIPWTDFRTWDAPSSLLPATGGNDDLGLEATGTWGTDDFMLRTDDKDSNGGVEYNRAYFAIPINESFILAATFKISFYAGMSVVADTSATLDLEVHVADRDGLVGSDLCTTAAQDINSATKSEITFTVDTSGLVRGDVLQCRVSTAINDGATGSPLKGEIAYVSKQFDLKG